MAFKIGEAHWHVLITFMENHPDFAKGRFVGPSGKTMQRRLWETLGNELNALGLGSRSVEKWQKSWADIKYTLKKKAAAAKREVVATGGGPPQYKLVLNQFEQRILNILGASFYKGIDSEECGVPVILEQEVSQIGVTFCSDERIPVQVQHPEVTPTGVASCSKKSNFIEQVIGHDHKYIEEPPEKRKKSTQREKENLMYEETIKELKLIRQEFSKINTHLSEISNTLKDMLDKQK